MTTYWTWSVLFVIGLTGCMTVPLTPAQTDGLTRANAFMDAAAKAYDVWRPRITVTTEQMNAGAFYQNGNVYLSQRVLGSRYLDVLLAHEMSHYLLGHNAAAFTGTSLDMTRLGEQRELEANAKAVEVLSRATGISEGRAATRTHLLLLNLARASLRTRGHLAPCDEVADLVRRFPELPAGCP